MDFLRQLTFENETWTKNLNSFETVACDDDDDVMGDDFADDDCADCDEPTADVQATKQTPIASTSSSSRKTPNKSQEKRATRSKTKNTPVNCDEPSTPTHAPTTNAKPKKTNQTNKKTKG